MDLIKELLNLNEADDDNEGSLADEPQSPQKNIKAVDLILRADGDIPLGKGSHNQCDKIGEEDGKKIFYVAIDPPHGNVEAYVVVDKSGNFSYYDFNDEVVVLNGKLNKNGTTDDWRNQLEEVIGEYRFEGGNVKPGGIDAFMKLLKTADD